MKGGRGESRAPPKKTEKGGGEMDRSADGQRPAPRRPDRSAFIKAVGGGGTERRASGQPRRR